MSVIQRLLIVLDKKTSLDEKLEAKHQDLISLGYYRFFRQEMDDFYIRECSLIGIAIDSESNSKAIINVEDLALRSLQRLSLLTFHRNSFKRAIAHHKLTNRRIWFPLSSETQNKLSGLELQFNKPLCHLLYVLAVVAYSFKKHKELLLQANGLETNLDSESVSAEKVYVPDLVSDNFPISGNRKFTYTHWLTQQFARQVSFFHSLQDSPELFHQNGCSFEFTKFAFPSLSRFNLISDYFGLVKMCLRLALKSRIPFLRVMLVSDEILISIKICAADEQRHYSEILFSSTRLVDKPLWATLCERFGCKIVFVNYAIAAEPTNPYIPNTQDGIWRLNSWQDMWVVDNFQIQDYEALTYFIPKRFEIRGIPPWGGLPLEQSLDLRPVISVFDTIIQANQNFSAGILDELGWNRVELEFEFIETVLKAASHFDVRVVHKKKRNKLDRFTNLREQMFSHFLKKYSDFYSIIDDQISADSIIDISTLVISKPISTTSVLALHANKHSIFLDPLGTLERNDSSLRYLPVISSLNELSDYLSTIFTRRMP